MVSHRQKPRNKPRKSEPNTQHRAPNPDHWIYGRHAVAAALRNPDRTIHRVIATKNAAEWLRSALPTVPAMIEAKPAEIDQLLPPGAVHQGITAEIDELAQRPLDIVCAAPIASQPVVVLDQVTDPQNIGAIFRVAAAFDARAIIVQDRRTPPLSGALAKSAAGAIETVPCVRVVNIARALTELNDIGYQTAGLAGDARMPISTLAGDMPTALVMGAEGAGLRKLVRETCDVLVHIPIAPAIESLNVATAAAITLYELRRGQI